MDNQKLMLYVALSFVLLMLWQAWQEDYGPKSGTPTTQVAEPLANGSGMAPPTTANSSAKADTSADIPKLATPNLPTLPPSPAQPMLKSAERIHVVTDLYNIEIDALGGDLRQIELRAYPVTAENPDQPFRFLSDNPEQFFIAQGGLLGNAAPNHYALYQIEQTNYRLADGATELQVPLSWRDPSGVEVIKTYVFQRGSYLVQIKYQVRNATNTEWRGQLYTQFQRTEPANKKSAFGIYTYTGGIVSSPETTYDKVDFARMKKENLSQDFKNGWLAMIEHYFAAAWIPPRDLAIHAYTKVVDGDRYVLGYTQLPVTVSAGGNATLATQLYVGPKVQYRMKEAAPNLELTVDYGKLTVIAQPIYWLLEVIQHMVSNWGWSIILLTIIIKAAFFHLSATSYKSMAQMRKLSPRIQALKERYGDDRQKMNEAMMEIYRKEKINPLGGCLPIVVQIPVFIALYWVLVESVELRQAPWMFWIHDLSAQDPYYVLPLIMGVTMFIQQKLSPAPPDPIQAKVMMFMPIMFTGMFLFFPSGLVLYWIVNNTLSITQQWYITNKLAKE
ncbi:membrane protein insertase YidC [Gammaproteobacteria bacterium]